VKHGNGLLDIFVDGGVGAALDILLNQVGELGAKADFHIGILLRVGDLSTSRKARRCGARGIDPRLVPGVLFSSHKFIEDLPAIVDIAPTILKLFGLALPSHFGGKAWDLAAKAQ